MPKVTKKKLKTDYHCLTYGWEIENLRYNQLGNAVCQEVKEKNRVVKNRVIWFQSNFFWLFTLSYNHILVIEYNKKLHEFCRLGYDLDSDYLKPYILIPCSIHEQRIAETTVIYSNYL